jgi:serine protein kinase
MTIFARYQSRYEVAQQEELSIQDYLDLCRAEQGAYASVAERMLQAIGEPELIDTRLEPRLSRIFANKMIKIYPAFKDFYGMEEVIENIVAYIRHAAQGLEEKKQILYLLGPVGGGKSSLAERLKDLMEKHPIYVLKAGDHVSPVFESPLGLFDAERMGPVLQEKYNIPGRHLTGLISPWAVKRIAEFDGVHY